MQLVIAAITISPDCISFFFMINFVFFFAKAENDLERSFNKILSCGLFGPATTASTLSKLKVIDSSKFCSMMYLVQNSVQF